jgi:hypothetical protein
MKFVGEGFNEGKRSVVDGILEDELRKMAEVELVEGRRGELKQQEPT